MCMYIMSWYYVIAVAVDGPAILWILWEKGMLFHLSSITHMSARPDQTVETNETDECSSQVHRKKSKAHGK